MVSDIKESTSSLRFLIPKKGIKVKKKSIVGNIAKKKEKAIAEALCGKLTKNNPLTNKSMAS